MAYNGISPHALIASGAKIGKNVKIGHFCVVDADVEIGDDCEIGNNVTITGRTKLGKHNRIYNGACVGVPPQDLKYAGEDTELVVGDDNIIREFVTLNIGTQGGGGRTSIGNNNLFMAYAHVAHDCVVGSHCIFANVATLGGHVHIGDYVNLGGLSAVHQFVKVGDGCMVGGVSALTQDLPPYCIAHGNHAFIIGLNKHRMRKIFTREEIDSISALYKRLFSHSAPMKDIAQKELDSPNISESHRYVCEFILSNTRGIAIKHKEKDND
ncbi:MAG: acyl-ACP--UDP-N-acetylglucosamine O-acyltransferase [Helicobacter sp.]|nr:acyl-ACP--UDP-N-acetylglucosamine O-acyltransferase [Helicobacter sp.]MDY5740736.1 acyl-ACP--UDP-N-acetylglucosamine O-acyltransferase [Helicobacter sp.]